MTPRPEVIVFSPDDLSELLGAMDDLQRACVGWINLAPGVDPDAPVPPADGLFAFISATGPAVPFLTWKPEAPARGQATRVVSVGVQHSSGPKVARHLSELGVGVPTGWLVRQDHPRRGLVVQVPASEGSPSVLAWMMAVARALCAVPIGAEWSAAVYGRPAR